MNQPNQSPEQDVIIEGHDYDGILEYDNPMPKWWLIIFGLTVVWSVYYVVAIEVGWINTYEKDLAAESAVIDEQQALWRASQIPVDEAYLQSKLDDAAFMAAGKSAYDTNCVACHGTAGEGLVGPNLTDDYWLHGGSLENIYHVVDQGVLDKGMLAWGGVLSHEELVGSVVYIRSLLGTNPANPKAPQGELYVPAAADDTAGEVAPDDAAGEDADGAQAPAGDAPAAVDGGAEDAGPSAGELAPSNPE